MDELVIGLITKPQGIKGELRVSPLTDSAERFINLKSIIIDDKSYTVTHSKVAGAFVIIAILGVNDRNTAETFRAKFVKVKRDDAVELKKGSYFIVDIVGCDLVVDGEKFGKITDITSGHTDVFTVQCINGKIMRFPFLKVVIKNIDTDAKIVEVYGQKLREIACYED